VRWTGVHFDRDGKRRDLCGLPIAASYRTAKAKSQVADNKDLGGLVSCAVRSWANSILLLFDEPFRFFAERVVLNVGYVSLPLKAVPWIVWSSLTG
jgi:hypothetical protein